MRSSRGESAVVASFPVSREAALRRLRAAVVAAVDAADAEGPAALGELAEVLEGRARRVALGLRRDETWRKVAQ